MIKTYYRLTKPGIIYGNLLPAIAGFFLASKGDIDFWLLLATLAGLSLVIGGACVINNYLDRGIDKKMERTKKRALAAELIPASHALIYAATILIAGSSLLAIFTNWLTLAIALLAVFIYVGPYGYFKRKSPLGTVVGSIAGAAPPVIGYCAVSGKLDGAALLLFLIMVFWQMPHFYSIAIYRLTDYKKAGIPVLPIKKGYRVTELYILLYIIAFTVAALLLGLLGYLNVAYIVVAALLGAYWLRRGLEGRNLADPNRWARKMFGTSLIVLLALTATITLTSFFN